MGLLPVMGGSLVESCRELWGVWGCLLMGEAASAGVLVGKGAHLGRCVGDGGGRGGRPWRGWWLGARASTTR